MQKVGQEIEVDFAIRYPGVPSPRVLWQRRQWRYLLLLIDRLPRDSHTHAALAMDEEYAEMVLQAKERAEQSGETFNAAPPGSDWGQVEELLATVNDRLAVLVEIQKAKPGQPTRYPRPITAFERVEYRRRQKAHESLAARVIAGRQ